MPLDEELDARLRSIEHNQIEMKAKVDLVITGHTSSIETLFTRTSAHQRMLLGDGDKVQGVASRLTALEKAEEARRWHIRSIWTAVTGLGLAAAWNKLFGH